MKDRNDNYKYISRKQIHIGKLKLEFAQKCLTLDDDNITIEKKLAQLQQLKECSRDFFRHEVEAMMIGEAQSQGICYVEKTNKTEKRLVTTMTALRCAIAQNYSETFFEKLFHATFGVFDRDYDWARNLENKYMEGKKIRYNECSNTTHSA